jgi:7-cyano-7-deazaguanosine (preQ0) biosynthesis protein QueE
MGPAVTASFLPVVEIFGPTIQGEGPYAGRIADFIRLGGCNLTCAWCDTAYSWDASRFDLRAEITPRSVQFLLSSLSPAASIVVLTGGEPLLHARKNSFLELLEALRHGGRSVHVETNGTLLPSDEVTDLVDVFVVSPKLANAALHSPEGGSILAEGWPLVAEQTEVHLKFVCQSEADVAAAVSRATSAGFSHTRTWVMPEAVDAPTFLHRWQLIADSATKHGVNASPRLHLLAWGEERGH